LQVAHSAKALLCACKAKQGGVWFSFRQRFSV
jgi:hypothetical protein